MQVVWITTYYYKQTGEWVLRYRVLSCESLEAGAFATHVGDKVLWAPGCGYLEDMGSEPANERR